MKYLHLTGWLLAGCLLLASLSARAANPTRIDTPPPPPEFKITEPTGPDEKKIIEVTGDWYIDKPIKAVNTHYKVYGNIYIAGGAKWELIDSELTVMCEYSRQFKVLWQDDGVLITRNSVLGGNFSDGRGRHCNFSLFDGTWDGIDTTVQYTYGIEFSWKDTEEGTLIGKRFNAGPQPDSIIISGPATLDLEDSTFPISMGLYTEGGGKVVLDLPTNTPITREFNGKTLLGAEPYNVKLKNVIVPNWFVFVRNIWPGNPESEIVIDRCDSLLVSLLGNNITGDVQLSDDLSDPIKVGAVTVRKGEGPVKLHMFGGLYFSGKENDATIYGPAKIAETMIWGGKVKMIGTKTKPLMLNCTTLDVKGTGNLHLDGVTLGHGGGNGQIIVEEQGKVTGENVTLGRLILKTEGDGTLDFDGYKATSRLTIKSAGGDVKLSDPQ